MSQSALAPRGLPRKSVFDYTIKDEEFKKSLERALKEAHQKVYEFDRPKDNKAYPPVMFNFWVLEFAKHELQNLGFQTEMEENQLRLLNRSGYECPVRLRFGQGSLDKGFIEFSANKGKKTKEGAKQNRDHFDPQMSLFPNFGVSRVQTSRELNLAIVYSITPKNMSSWIACYIGEYSSKRFTCIESSLIFSGSVPPSGQIPFPTILPPNDDGGFTIDIEDR